VWLSAQRLLRANAFVALGLGVLLLLGSLDSLYQALNLPQAKPALIFQVAGALIVGLAHLLWRASATPQLADPAARAAALGTGLGAFVLIAWLVSGRLSVVPQTQVLAAVVAAGFVVLTVAMIWAISREALGGTAPEDLAPSQPVRRRARRRRRPPNPFARLARGVPALSAEGMGLFRVFLGLGLLYGVQHYVQTEVAGRGDYGLLNSWAAVDAFAADPSAVTAVKVVTITALVLFTVGLFTRAAYAIAVLGIGALVVVSLEAAGAHDWGPPFIALLVMTVVRWGDGVSLDAAVRRLRGRGSPRPRDHTYGLAIWLPGFMLGLGFLAAAWAKIAVNGGFAWALTGAVQFHWVEDAGNAPVEWGLWIAQHQWLAVLLATAGLVVEATFIAHAFYRSDLVRGVFGLIGLSLLLGFMLFQGIFWLAWWLLLAALLPWQRLTEAVMALMPVQVVITDGTCALCRRTARVLHAADVFNRLHFLDANDGAARERYAPGISAAAALATMHVADIDARTVRGGYDGYVLLARSVPVLLPMALLGNVPGVRGAGLAVYSRIAAARGHDGHCSDHEPFITNFPMYSGTCASRALSRKIGAIRSASRASRPSAAGPGSTSPLGSKRSTPPRAWWRRPRPRKGTS
jgi:predicted DCC family thiol-disulfide oxidoreductase YuxK